ncbi:MAG: hypothetical protein IPM39_17800 [Chloroflexi bacterium]|nr:hypothetical protein [Chloroflexota bacterium]
MRLARVMESINANLEGNFVNLQLPIGEGPDFKGIIDLVKMEARLGEKSTVAPIPADMADEAEEARMALIEAAAEGDDALMEKYFEEENLSSDEIIRGLKGAMMQGLATPIIYSAPEPGIAVDPVVKLLGLCLRPIKEPLRLPMPPAKKWNWKLAICRRWRRLVFKTREDPYGKSSYIRVFGGILASDSRVWAANLESEVRVGTLQAVTAKTLRPFPVCTAATSAWW